MMQPKILHRLRRWWLELMAFPARTEPEPPTSPPPPEEPEETADMPKKEIRGSGPRQRTRKVKALRARSAVTGKFVTGEEAEASPETTVRESYDTKGKGCKK